jgi:hypothetical protein
MTTNYATQHLVIKTSGANEEYKDGRLLPEHSLGFKILKSLIARAMAAMDRLLGTIYDAEKKAKMLVDGATQTLINQEDQFCVYLTIAKKRSNITNGEVCHALLESIFGPVTANFERNQIILTSDGIYMVKYSYQLLDGRPIFASLIIGNTASIDPGQINTESIDKLTNSDESLSLIVYSFDKEIRPGCTVIDMDRLQGGLG